MKHRQDREPEILDSRMDQTGIRDRARAFIGTEQAGTSCKIILVGAEDIPHIWEKVIPHVKAAELHSEGELTPEDFFEILMKDDMQLWVAVESGELLASMITQIITYTRKRVLRIISIGGDEMERWIKFLPLVENWALKVGCTSLECWGRKGWLKILQDWKCSYHIITKDLTHRMH